MFCLFDGGAGGRHGCFGFGCLLGCPGDHRGIDLLGGDVFPLLPERSDLFVKAVGPVFRLRQKLCGSLGAGVGFGGGLGRAVGLGFGDPHGIGGGDGGCLRRR